MARKSMKKSKKAGCWGGMKGGGGTCGAPVMGGKRRSRRIRGGAAGVGPAITVGTLENKYVDTATPVDPKTGAAMPDIYDIPKSGGRRRTRKGGRKSRKTRKMKGGAQSISAQNSGYGYTGTGAGGLADATPTSSNPGNAF